MCCMMSRMLFCFQSRSIIAEKSAADGCTNAERCRFSLDGRPESCEFPVKDLAFGFGDATMEFHMLE